MYKKKAQILHRINPLPMNIVLQHGSLSIAGMQLNLPRLKARRACFDVTNGKIRIRNQAKDIIGGKFSAKANITLINNQNNNGHIH
jgi:hypothetical protein